ncbi:DNA starvation/stationary phase protection protein [Hyphomonas sp. WL0036]|uniref:Dps family protein n=1 Tax=Hyphomonas sediminis TaxID=2866160 RepID=UPI001C805E68|nr:Dps family protein [Hyphomonas sediminis]MBY9066604.1 DNA starvation/stationary phase protection protein [Hyphomonas sediminis]
MSIDIGMSDKARKASADALKDLLGETYALYVKTHGYHWNVTGPRFNSLHAMFMTQYTELWTALDELAERIRALGHFAPGSSGEMMERATIKPDNGVPDADEMVKNLAAGHEAVARAAKKGIAIAEEADDPVSVDLFTQRAQIAEKTAWMLRASV